MVERVRTVQGPVRIVEKIVRTAPSGERYERDRVIDRGSVDTETDRKSQETPFPAYGGSNKWILGGAYLPATGWLALGGYGIGNRLDLMVGAGKDSQDDFLAQFQLAVRF